MKYFRREIWGSSWREIYNTILLCDLQGDKKLLKYRWRVGINNIYKNGWMDDNEFGK